MQETTPDEHAADSPEDEPAPTDDRWDDELIAGHEYDGIREYDNPVPGWLSLLFVGTIVWSLFYMVAAGLDLVAPYEETYEENLEAIRHKQMQAAAQKPDVTRSTILGALDSEKRVEQGEKVFKNNCAVCHGENGGGKDGPNLTDDYWLHGGKLMAIYKTVRDGVDGKGMPAWGPQLSTKELESVVAYIRSIRGSEPDGAKEPEGEKFVPGQNE